MDTGDATGRLLLHMLGAIAQFETEIRAERQMDELRHRREQGVLIKTLMQDYRLSKASVYRYLGETDTSQSANHL